MKKDIHLTLTPLRTWGISLAVLLVLVVAPLYLSTDAVKSNTVHGVIGESTALKGDIESTGTPRVEDKSLVYMGTVTKRDPAPFLSLGSGLVLLLTASCLLGLAGLAAYALRCKPSATQAAMAVAPGVFTFSTCLMLNGLTHAAFLAIVAVVIVGAGVAAAVQLIRQSNATFGTTGGTATAQIPVSAPPLTAQVA